MTDSDRQWIPGPLDETDVERAIADEDAPEPPLAMEDASEADEERRASVDFTAEDLEREMENGGPSLEEQVVHVEDAVVEVLDDERDVVAADLAGEQAEELEWRMSEASAGEAAGTRAEGARRVGDRTG